MSHILTLISNPATRALGDELAGRVAEATGARRIDWLARNVAADLHLAAPAPLDGAIADALGGAPVDAVVQPDNGRKARRRKLLLADMDSTMIGQECIDELAAEVGLKDRIAAITARAMAGEIAFESALRARVALLEGLPVAAIDRVIATRIHLTPGGPELVRTMRAHGAFCVLVSGGFTDFTARVAAQIGFDEHRANRLIHADGRLTGKVAEPILGRAAKAEALDAIAARRGLTPQDAIAVGDGANDLAMLEKAGAGVALHAKPAVAARADMRIDHGDLTALLYIQGYREDEIVR